VLYRLTDNDYGMRGPDEKQWYLVYTKPRQEKVAQSNLVRQGYETYLPLIRQSRRRLSKRVTVTSSMFPRYLFIFLDKRIDNWGPIRSTLGVVSLVRFGQTPAKVPRELVRLLRSREDIEGIQVVPLDEYRPGSRIRITDGSLSGYEGLYLARSGRDRVTVLLDIMGKTARTRVDAAAIEPTH
jgi:transcriptional antiterminator RfaH